MRAFVAVFTVLSCETARLGAGEIRFVAPFTIRDVKRPVTVAAGDWNRDGKRDLVTASGSGGIELFLQEPASRTVWTKASLPVGQSTYMVRAADLDGDGYDDILAADTASTAYLLRNNRGVFESPHPLKEARSARWITLGDWNTDGRLDLASANFDLNTVSIFLGDAEGGLAFLKNYFIGEPHAVEGLDHDGDGDLDLMVGHGDHGIRAVEGSGDGTFTVRGLVTGFPPCARFVFTGDFNRDGKGDLALTCLRDSPQGVIANSLAGTSNGDGSYQQTLDVITDDIATAAVADLDGDGTEDVAIVSVKSRVLSVYPGKGDGTFLPEVPFGPIGEGASFVIAADLDGDGREDAVSADTTSSTLTVLWGNEGEQFLEAGKLIQEYTGAASGVADLDGDGAVDFFLPRSTPPKVDVFLKPGFRSSSVPSLTIPTAEAFNYLTAIDLDADAIPDLAGINLKSSMLHVAFLDASGSASGQLALPVGGLASGVAAGRLDGGGTVDLAVPRFSSGDIALFLNQGRGAFVAAAPIPTLERPKTLVLGDADSDGLTDLVVAALGLVAIHFGKGDGTFTEPLTVLSSDPPRTFLDVALADVSGDSIPDLLAAAPGTTELLILRGKGNRELEEPTRVQLSSGPRSISLADLDRDGLLDITTANSGKTVSFIFNRGMDGLEPPFDFGGALPPALDHLVLDLNRDGAMDLVLFAVGTTYVFDGLPPAAPPSGSFRRGDADANGKAEITDAIALLRYLFVGAESPCEDSSDADDDGRLSLTDALVILRWLFQGEPAPGAPGPELCGKDPTPDELRGCPGECR